MEKCVFLGYPDGYKGWKFYNPTSKHTLISERADFDERYFPMSKRLSSPSQPSPTMPAPVPTSPPVEPFHPGATLDSESECNEVLDHVLILGVCAPLIVLLDAFLVITSAVSFQG